VKEVCVATDDERIAEVVRDFGGNVLLTSPEHTSGTHRVFEAARYLKGDLLLNLQGDEPLILPDQIDQIVTALEEAPEADIVTLRVATEDSEEILSPNCVKVVVDHCQYALYFSRAPIPFYRDFRDSKDPATFSSEIWGKAWIHIGLYGFRRATINLIPDLTPSPWEEAEQLEQLRFLYWGFKILVIETAHRTLGVDVPEDLPRVERALSARVSGDFRLNGMVRGLVQEER
jgi:3-deoxy-manno-octulosonate cytidylyltransferase (CMP-KDO synthetase)